MSRVAVALSGGVDSAVAAVLLKEQGFEVIGLTGKMTYSDNSEHVVYNAKKVAEKIGIEHYVFDVKNLFQEKIIEYFENTYKKGQTPNPCIMCNKYIKWGALFDYAISELKCNFISTGHYADIKIKDNYYKLYPANDEVKDQLYFLFLLNQSHLSKTLFPLSNYKKNEIRVLAEKYNLPSKSAKDSQDICFIQPPLTTKKYLNNIFPINKGCFIEKTTGKVLGNHDGFWQFTIGQRKGIGLSAPEPLYVTGIDAENNIVYVGYKNELQVKELILRNIEWSYPQEKMCFEALVKIRYNMKAVPAKITYADVVNIRFLEPVYGIAAGQACVLYDINDGHLLGGGFI